MPSETSRVVYDEVSKVAVVHSVKYHIVVVPQVVPQLPAVPSACAKVRAAVVPVQGASVSCTSKRFGRRRRGVPALAEQQSFKGVWEPMPVKNEPKAEQEELNEARSLRPTLAHESVERDDWMAQALRKKCVELGLASHGDVRDLDWRLSQWDIHNGNVPPDDQQDGHDDDDDCNNDHNDYSNDSLDDDEEYWGSVMDTDEDSTGDF